MWFDALVVTVSVIAGAVAAVTGFGIGSLLTPMLALSVDTRVAVAAVSIPHVVGTAVRFWLLQGGIDRRVLWSFGLTSAAGGLVGAALYSIASNRWLNVVFGLLLLFAAISEVTGLARQMRFRGWVAWVAGALSGAIGRTCRQPGRHPIRRTARVRPLEREVRGHGNSDCLVRRWRACSAVAHSSAFLKSGSAVSSRSCWRFSA